MPGYTVPMTTLRKFMKAAPNGGRLTYHKGHLGADRVMFSLMGTVVPVEHVDEVARVMWRAYTDGEVMLMQERLPESQGFAYIAQRKRY